MILGSQYYRFPTPLSKDWEKDIKNMNKLGFNTVKIWAQWRSNEPKKGVYDFSDIEKLLNLAYENSLKVHINIILDVAPAWFYKKYKNSKMITSEGRIVEPQSVAWRQIGGAPGPCYHHFHAKKHKKAFIEALVKKFANHPALEIWDVWNEPELTCGILREADLSKMTCYCKSTEKAFKKWLKNKYRNIDNLNMRWKQCYCNFDEVELPRTGNTFINMIDFRKFHIETITEEAKMRINAVKKFDNNHPVMLHTVPMPCFNAVNACSDEFELATLCDCFGNSVGSQPFPAVLGISAAENKTVINAEIHAFGGNTNVNFNNIDFNEYKRHVLIPLSLGVKGFLFWQYRAELAGFESPAWGMTKLNGEDSIRTQYAEKLFKSLALEPLLEEARPVKPKIGIVNNYMNQLFDFCVNNDTYRFYENLYGIFESCYNKNYDVSFVFYGQLTEKKLKEFDVLIYPMPYFMENHVAELLKNWVKNGGVLISETSFGAYNYDSGLHSDSYIGCGFQEVFGAVSNELQTGSRFVNAYRKNWSEMEGNNSVPFTLNSDLGYLAAGSTVCGFFYKQNIELTTATSLAEFDDGNIAVSYNEYGRGKAILVGSLCGISAAKSSRRETKLFYPSLLRYLNFLPTYDISGLRIDALKANNVQYLIVQTYEKGEYEICVGSAVKCYDVIEKNEFVVANEKISFFANKNEVFLLKIIY